jgi:hypothetical protein
VTEHFLICAKDPSGEVVTTGYEARLVPRLGDRLALPEPGLRDWQDMSVVGVYPKPQGQVTVELGGTDGWEPGSVKRLFEAVLEFNRQADQQLDELKEVLPKARADYLPD